MGADQLIITIIASYPGINHQNYTLTSVRFGSGVKLNAFLLMNCSSNSKSGFPVTIIVVHKSKGPFLQFLQYFCRVLYAKISRTKLQ